MMYAKKHGRGGIGEEKMWISVDVGYSETKAVYGEKMIVFPSIVGSPDESRFSLNGTGEDNSVMEFDGQSYLVGAEALAQSRFAMRKQDRGWINSQEYKILFLTALAQITESSRVNIDIVTGLPVNFYDGDKETLRKNLLGQYKIKYNNRPSQVFTIRDLRVIPQPFGTAFSVALNDNGKAFESNLYATGNIGVIDIGGKTVNLLTVNRLKEIGTETESVNSGTWKAVLAVKKEIVSQYPKLGEMQDHKVAEIIRQGTLDYFDGTIDISDIANREFQNLASEILTKAANLWDEGADLNKILIAGGGALLVGDSIKAEFPHAEIVENPVFANAIGYWKFAQRP